MQKMENTESIFISGAQQYSLYKGYAENFTFKGINPKLITKID
jgi:hypothetical protein